MKTLEIILRLIDKLLTAISFKKAQNERDKLEQNPADFFISHFNSGVSDTADKTDKANTKDNSTS
jgi:hypothetical protein